MLMLERGTAAAGLAAWGVLVPLAGPGVQVTAWGERLAECRTLADALLAGVPVPGWAAAAMAAAQPAMA
jgi:hypothetical protein